MIEENEDECMLCGHSIHQGPCQVVIESVRQRCGCRKPPPQNAEDKKALDRAAGEGMTHQPSHPAETCD